MSSGSDTDIHNDFSRLVNMTPSELEKWLGTDESKNAGQSDRGGESIGHKSGRRIVDILHTKKADLTGDDEQHMHKVVGYIKRHLAQRPSGDISQTTWRYSLMNWGHDPLK